MPIPNPLRSLCTRPSSPLAATLAAHLVLAWLYASVLLAPEVLPLVDLGGHVELGMALRHLDDGSALARKFEYGVFPAPNSAFYLLFYAASSVLAPLLAAKAVVALYLFGTPLALLYLLHVSGRDVSWSLLAYPLLLNWPFQSGFIDYCLSFAPCLLGLALLYRVLHERAPYARTFVALGLASFVVFLSHFQGAVLYALGTGCLLAWRAPLWSSVRVKTWAQAALASSVAVALLMLLWLARSRSLVHDAGGGGMTWQTPEEKLRALVSLSFFVLESGDDGIIAYLVLGSALLAQLLGARRASVDGFSLLLLTCVVVHAFAPVTIGQYWHFDNRMLALVSLFVVVAFASARPSATTFRSAASLAGMLAAAALSLAIWKPAMESFEQWNAGFVETLSRAPKQSRLAMYIEDGSGSGFSNPPARHYAGYHAALNLGTNSSSFADHPGRIVVQRELGNDFELADLARVRSAHGLDRYDVLLHVGRSRLEQSLPQRLTLIARNQRWSLYAIEHAR